MESRFAHLRQRDNSVSMLRVKMSRRRSQAQKENRERMVNTRRQLDVSSIGNMSVVQEEKKCSTQQTNNVAGEERLKQLQRWKERKAVEKEKEQREKGCKRVFKTGLYHPKDSLSVKPLPPVPAASGRARETKESAAPAPSTRVTRSMKQTQMQKPLKMLDANLGGKKTQPPVERASRLRGVAPKPAPSQCKTKEPTTRGPSTRSKPPVTVPPVLKDKPKDKSADVRSTRSRAAEVATCPAAAGKTSDDKLTVPGESVSKVESEEDKSEEDDKPRALESEEEDDKPRALQSEEDDKPRALQSEEDDKPRALQSEEEEMAVEPTGTAPAALTNASPNAASFAPAGFLFKAPTGLSSFKFDPMTPRSADAFLTPSSSFSLPSAPIFDDGPQEEKKPSPPKSPRRSPPPTTEAAEEPKHDVPYFRSQIANETERLTGLGAHWESKVEEESIPEEMRDGMRTAVGQARLLMKERFRQFSGLVDDCEFNRGEKVTTCTDLQGFWDMVYFQVEDVNKKFDALKAAEARGWVEEYKPPPPQRKVVKKAAAALSKPAGTKAAAKSRLAAAKAAMKARFQAAEMEKAEQGEGTEQHPQNPEAESANTAANEQRVQSPAKLSVSVRRSSRLSAITLPPQSPSSNYLTPRRTTRRSLALAQTPKTSTNPPTPFSLQHPENKTPAAAVPCTAPQSESTVCVRLSLVKDMSSEAAEENKDGQSISCVTEEQDRPAEDLNLCLSQSLCKSPVKSPSPVASAALSFTLSPCTAQLSSSTVSRTPGPAVSCTPQVQLNLQGSCDSAAATPDRSVNEGLPGFDFERYLQPSQRDSLSPQQPFAMESPVAMDVDMESPRGQSESPLTQQDAVPTALPSVPTLVSPQTVESALLLFTPDTRDRIRQSVCPSDLMVFTPPHL